MDILSLFLSVVMGWTSNQGTVIPTSLTAEYNPQAQFGWFHGKEVPVTWKWDAPLKTNDSVLGVTTSNKRIEVDLTNQKLYAVENGTRVMEFLISSGKWGRTPTGEFKIWSKLVSTKMSGGSKALHTYYYLPNVPYTMYFYNEKIPMMRGYGIHGAYWHNNFGHPMSHGCINMKPDEAKQLFYWAEPAMPEKKRILTVTDDMVSTPITIYGEAPKE